MPETVLARGPNFVYALEFLRSTYGEDRWQRILRAMPPAAAEVWAGPLLVTGTYPFTAFKAMLGALEEVTGAQAREETARLYEHIADRSLTTIHKIFFRFTDPSFVIKRYPLLWKRFFLAGRVRVPVASATGARVDFEVPEIFLDWLPPACYGYSKKAIELAGGTLTDLEEGPPSELDGGQWTVSYTLRWNV